MRDGCFSFAKVPRNLHGQRRFTSPRRIFCIRYILWLLAGFWHVWIGAAGFLDELGLVWILLPFGFFSSDSNLWFQLLVPTSDFTSGFYFSSCPSTAATFFPLADELAY